jgi:hypothetical protein
MAQSLSEAIAKLKRGSMNQQHLSDLGFSPKADLTLSLTSGEAGELMKILKPLAVMPENHDDYPAARLVFVIYGRLRKLANEAAKEHVKHDHIKD